MHTSDYKTGTSNSIEEDFMLNQTQREIGHKDYMGG
jgi:hypothetical protein